MGTWSDLPADLLMLIHQHIDYYVDTIVFNCVCTHWQSTWPELPNLWQPQPPWLLLPYKTGSSCGLYHPFEKKVYKIDLPEAGEKVFRGSGHGWVVTAELNGSIDVVNPLTRVRIPLPPRHTFKDFLEYHPDNLDNECLFRGDTWDEKPDAVSYTLGAERARNYWLLKIALSSVPTSDNFGAAAIYGKLGRLAYYNVGNEEWRDFFDFDADDICYGVDLTFCDGKLYALTSAGDLMVCDDIFSCPQLRMLVPSPYCYFGSDQNLINSSSRLLTVKRDKDVEEVGVGKRNDTKFKITTLPNFKVWKLNMGSSSWTPLESLGSEILFMGLGMQLGIPSRDLGRSDENRIYFNIHELFYNCEDREDRFDGSIFDFEEKKHCAVRV